MRKQILELFNINKLNKPTQEKAVAAFDKLLLETGHPDQSLYMRVFIHALGGHRLDEAVQVDLRDKISGIVELERHGVTIPASMFKWDSSAAQPLMVNEDMKVANYRWGKSETVKTIGTEDKIKKSSYKWRE